MSKMNHIMIDLETLSSNDDAAIIQIGAVAFDLTDIDTGFRATIDMDDAVKHGMVSGSTLKWWMEQTDSARKSVTNGTLKLTEALEQLNTYINQFKDPQFWAHATFDFPILMRAYRVTDTKKVIPYRSLRDLRTIESFWGNTIKWEKREGVHHDALDDAIFQAKHTQLMLREADTALQRRIDE